MSDDREKNGGKSGEEFLSRWSRLKQEAGSQPPAGQQPAIPVADPKAPLPKLPPLDKLTMDSDFRGFFHPKVGEDLRRAALKKLFADPHFNIMDGLDVYIDDYSKPDPLPAAMLAQLRQAQKIIEWAKENTDDAAAKTAKQPAENTPLPLAGPPQFVERPQDAEQCAEPQSTKPARES